MDQTVTEVSTFCELVIGTLGEVLREKGFTANKFETGSDGAKCDFKGPNGDLRFVYKPREGEVNCLIKYPRPGSSSDWVYLTQHVEFGRDLSDDELAEDTDSGTESLEASVKFFGTFLKKL